MHRCIPQSDSLCKFAERREDRPLSGLLQAQDWVTVGGGFGVGFCVGLGFGVGLGVGLAVGFGVGLGVGSCNMEAGFVGAGVGAGVVAGVVIMPAPRPPASRLDDWLWDVAAAELLAADAALARYVDHICWMRDAWPSVKSERHTSSV